MNKTLSTLLLVSQLFFIPINSWAQDHKNSITQKDWTLLIYLSGDNNLSQFMKSGIRRLKRAYTGSRIHLVIQFDGDKQNDSKRFSLSKLHKDSPSVETVYESQVEYNMGDQKTLIDFIQWGKSTFPARQVALVLNAHGRGILKVPESDGSFLTPSNNKILTLASSSDDSSGSYIDESSFVSSITKNWSKNIDLVVYDSCLMGNLEVLSLISQIANYAIASEYTICINSEDDLRNDDGIALNLEKWVNYLSQNPQSDPIQAGQFLIDEFKKSYENFYIPTSYEEAYGCKSSLALFDLKYTTHLLTQISQLFSNIEKISQVQPQIYNDIIIGVLKTPYVHPAGYVDLNLLIQVLESVYLKYSLDLTPIQEIKNTVQQAVKSKTLLHIDDKEPLAGLSIFFPTVTLPLSSLEDFIDYYSQIPQLQKYSLDKHIKNLRIYYDQNKFDLLYQLVSRILKENPVKIRPSDSKENNENFTFVLMEVILENMASPTQLEKVEKYKQLILNSDYTSPKMKKHKQELLKLAPTIVK